MVAVEEKQVGVGTPTAFVRLDAGLSQLMECSFAITDVTDDKAFSKFQIKKGDKVVLKGSFRDNVLALKHYPAIHGACLVKKD